MAAGLPMALGAVVRILVNVPELAIVSIQRQRMEADSAAEMTLNSSRVMRVFWAVSFGIFLLHIAPALTHFALNFQLTPLGENLIRGQTGPTVVRNADFLSVPGSVIVIQRKVVQAWRI